MTALKEVLGLLEDDLEEFFFGCPVEIDDQPRAPRLRADSEQLKEDYNPKQEDIVTPLKNIKCAIRLPGYESNVS